MKSIKTKIIIITILFVGILTYSPAVLHATDIVDTDINTSTNPENPGSYQDVTVTLSSYATDLNQAMIEWRSGSNLLLSGYGKTSYSFKTGAPNTRTVFNVSIRPAGSMLGFNKVVSVTASDLELLWQSVNGYTPPFYKGKSFATSKSKIKVVAFASTSKPGDNNVSYKWKRNDTSVQDNSGFAKNSFTFVNSELKSSENIEATASSVDGNYNAIQNIDIPIITPKILFYKKSPTEGVLFNQAILDGTTMSEDEFTLLAAPYFSTFPTDNGSFDYTWQINGKTIDTPSDPTELTLRPSSRGGYATINLVIEDMSALFQKAVGQLKINL